MKNFLSKPFTVRGYLKFCGGVLAIYAIGGAIWYILATRQAKKVNERHQNELLKNQKES